MRKVVNVYRVYTKPIHSAIGLVLWSYFLEGDRVPLQKIVLATGVTGGDVEMLGGALTLAQVLGASLTSLAVVGRRASQARAEGRALRLREKVQRLGAEGRVPVLLQRGSTPLDALRQATYDGAFDAVALASPGRRQRFASVSGSGVAPILRGVRLPLLMLPVAQLALAETISSVLFPIDLMESSLGALDEAAEIARQHDATLHLLRVHDQAYPAPPHPDRAAATSPGALLKVDRAQAEALRERAAAVAPRVEVAMRDGRSHQQIARYANEIDASIVVLANHGARSVGEVLGGTLVERTLELASAPVVVVRA